MKGINLTGMNPKNKSSVLVWLALAVTLALVIWTTLQEDSSAIDVVEGINTSAPTNDNIATLPAPKVSAPTATQSNSQLIDWEMLKRPNSTDKKTTRLFNEHSWVVTPPAPKVVNLPPPPPTAPPLPFAYMGRLDNSPKGNLIYLSTLNHSYSVVIGNKVDAFWKLEKEDAQNLYFTYLPLNLPKVLDKNQRLNTPETSTASTADIVNAFSQ